MAPWLRHVHLHNNDGQTGTCTTPLGQGMIPMARISLPRSCGAEPRRRHYTIENQNCEPSLRLALRAEGLSGRNDMTRAGTSDLFALPSARRTAPSMDAAAPPSGGAGQAAGQPRQRWRMYSVRLAGHDRPGERSTIERCRVLVFAADNGVTAEGVSATPVSVTLSQVLSI